MVATRTGGHGTWAENDAIRVHLAGVEDQPGAMQQTAVVIVAKNKDGRLVLDVLVDEELRVVRGIGWEGGDK